MANNITVKDGAASNVVLKSTDNAGVHTPHHAVDGTVTVDATGQGDVPVTLDGESVVLAAGTNQIGEVGLVGGQTIARAAISAASSGDNTIVAAATDVKTKVLGLALIAAGDVDVRIEDGAGGTALTGAISLAADGNGFVLPVATPGLHWLETSVNTLLNLELSAAVQVSGFVVYYQEA